MYLLAVHVTILFAIPAWLLGLQAHHTSLCNVWATVGSICCSSIHAHLELSVSLLFRGIAVLSGANR